jgi:hypothetical protein
LVDHTNNHPQKNNKGKIERTTKLINHPVENVIEKPAINIPTVEMTYEFF